MAKLEKFVPKERVEIQDNIYTAKILSVDVKVWAPDNKSLNWKFELFQPPFIGQKVWTWGSTGTAPTPKARLTAWGAALGYSREQLSSDEFDTEVLVGSYVKIFVKTWAKENGEMKQGVTDLIPLTEADQQLLQMWLQQASLTGPAKVAVQASAPVVSVPFVQTLPNSGTPAQPVVPVNVQPTVAPVSSAPAVTPRRTGSFPF